MVSRAGHPRPLLVRSDADVTAVGRSGSLLGVLTDLQLSEQPFALAQGDALALFTDGIAERRRGEVGDDMAVSALGVPRGATPAAHPHAAEPTVTTMAAG